MDDSVKILEPGMDFRVGDWLVRPTRGVMQSNGQEQRLKPKAMAVLQCLACANGHVVTRNELFDTVWPGAVVSDATLSQCIVELRKGFGESAKDAQLIETVPKVGFRLTQPVQSVERATEKPQSRRWIWAGVFVVALALAVVLFRNGSGVVNGNGEVSIAVLPFVDMSPLQDQGHFADGLTEELIHNLSQMDKLAVTARTSSFMFKDRGQDLREVARILGVRYLLEGSVRKSAEQVRVTANLVDSDTGTPLWSETYERPAVDYFELQDEIAQSVTAATGIGIGVGQPGHIFGTTHIEAYEEAMKAYAGKLDGSVEATLVSIEHLMRATEIDPDYAFAWAGLSSYYIMHRDRISPDWQSLADEYWQKAVDLRADDPLIKRFAVYKHVAFEEWAEAEQVLAQLTEAYRTPLIHERLELLLKVGRVSEAIELGERMRIRDPLGDGVRIYLQQAYAASGRPDDALAQAEYLWGQWPRVPTAQEGLIVALNSGDRAAIDVWMERILGFPDVRHIYQPMADNLDDREAALAVLRRFTPDISADIYPAAMWAGYWDDPELAMYFMQMLPDPWAFWMPHNKGLRRLPEFRQMVADMGLVDYWQEFGWNDFCRPEGEAGFTCD